MKRMKRYAGPPDIKDFIGKDLWVKSVTQSYFRPLRIIKKPCYDVLVYNRIYCDAQGNPEFVTNDPDYEMNLVYHGRLNTMDTWIAISCPLDTLTTAEVLEFF